MTASRTLRTFDRRVNSGAEEEAEKLVMILFEEKVVMVKCDDEKYTYRRLV